MELKTNPRFIKILEKEGSSCIQIPSLLSFNQFGILGPISKF